MGETGVTQVSFPHSLKSKSPASIFLILFQVVTGSVCTSSVAFPLLPGPFTKERGCRTHTRRTAGGSGGAGSVSHWDVQLRAAGGEVPLMRYADQQQGQSPTQHACSHSSIGSGGAALSNSSSFCIVLAPLVAWLLQRQNPPLVLFV